MDRAGLAITTILASTVLQADARKTIITTFLDIYFNVSISFQFMTFFLSLVSAHYIFDPDYFSEDLLIEDIQAAQRSVAATRGPSLHLRSDVMDDVKDGSNDNDNPRFKPAPAEDTTKSVDFYISSVKANRDLKFLKTPAEYYLRFANSVLGDKRDMVPDRIGRVTVVPGFFVVMIVLPFVPNDINRDALMHPKAGVNSALFQVSLAMLLGWLLIVTAKVALECAGYKAPEPVEIPAGLKSFAGRQRLGSSKGHLSGDADRFSTRYLLSRILPSRSAPRTINSDEAETSGARKAGTVGPHEADVIITSGVHETEITLNLPTPDPLRSHPL